MKRRIKVEKLRELRAKLRKNEVTNRATLVPTNFFQVAIFNQPNPTKRVPVFVSTRTEGFDGTFVRLGLNFIEFKSSIFNVPANILMPLNKIIEIRYNNGSVFVPKQEKITLAKRLEGKYIQTLSRTGGGEIIAFVVRSRNNLIDVIVPEE